MFSYKDRLRAVQLYIKLDKRIGLTIRVEFGERVSQPRPMTLTVRTLSVIHDGAGQRHRDHAHTHPAVYIASAHFSAGLDEVPLRSRRTCKLSRYLTPASSAAVLTGGGRPPAGRHWPPVPPAADATHRGER